MARKLLEMLGYDQDDPRVEAGRRHGAAIARLIDSLVALREKHELTQQQVAHVMDTTQSAVSNFERQSGDPKLSTLLRYADAIGAEIDIHVSGSGPSEGYTRTVIAKSAPAGGSSRYPGASVHVVPVS